MESSIKKQSQGNPLPSPIDSVIRLPLSVHAFQYGLTLVFIALLRVNTIANVVDSVLSSLSLGDSLGHPIGWFKPLSVECWIVHMVTLVPGLEIMAWFRDAATSCPSSEKDRQTLYQAFYFLFAIGQVQGILSILSHFMIDVNDSLEFKLFQVSSFVIRLSVFGTPFFVLLPSLIGWNASFATILPLLTYLINNNILTFASVPGIVVSSGAMLVVMSRRDLPILFKIGWVLLSVLPTVVPDTTTDVSHMIGAAELNVPLFLMAYGLLTTRMSTTTKAAMKQS